MEIEVGNYIRTYLGTIGKVIRYDEGEEKYYTDNYKMLDVSAVYKHSKNIIDLVEEDDILLVKDTLYDNLYKTAVFKAFDNDLCINNFEVSEIIPLKEYIENNQIEVLEILTHEQFEQNSYKL